MLRFALQAKSAGSELSKTVMLFSTKAADDTDRVRVKICGLTREDDVVTCIEAGADAVGFVCYPSSPRYVTPSRLMSLLSLVPDSVTKVLLFVNPTSEEVREHLAFFPGVVLQFHGNESRAFCDQFHVPYIKAVPMSKPEDLLVAQQTYQMANALLADAVTEGWGGNGQSFDWQACLAVREKITKPLIVAGGLKEQNVSHAIRVLKPWAVDVASGVETARGIKDHDKILRFIDSVRRGGDMSCTCEMSESA